MDDLSFIYVLVAVAAIFGVLILWLIMTFNKFRAKQSKIDDIWDEVDAHLKMRHDLVPELLDLAEGHMGENAPIFKKILDVNMKVRSEMDEREAAPFENELSTLLRDLRGEVSKMPELMLDQKFITTLSELVSMEGRASSACDRHNALVREYNKDIVAFPAIFISRFLHFDPCEMRIFGA